MATRGADTYCVCAGCFFRRFWYSAAIMLKIRFQRTGRTKMPTYRIVVAEHTSGPKAGKFVERLGSYNAKTKERVLNEERAKYWLSVGARPSDTMHNLLVTLGIMKGSKVNVLPKYVAPEKPAEEAAPEVPVEVAAETPAEEVVPEAPAAETPTTEAAAESTEEAAA
jgi:small subunit ribosomal protein S16